MKKTLASFRVNNVTIDLRFGDYVGAYSIRTRYHYPKGYPFKGDEIGEVGDGIWDDIEYARKRFLSLIENAIDTEIELPEQVLR